MFDDTIESIFIEVNKSDFNLDRNVIGILYRPSNTEVVFIGYLGNVEGKKKTCYIVWDYNINLLNHNNIL